MCLKKTNHDNDANLVLVVQYIVGSPRGPPGGLEALLARVSARPLALLAPVALVATPTVR